MKRILFSLLMLTLVGLYSSVLYAQMDALHGVDDPKIGVMDANNFRISVWNDGTFGGRAGSSKTHPAEVGGEWPINTGHYYLIDGNPMVVGQVQDVNGEMQHILSTNKSVNISQTRGPQNPNDPTDWWTFLPLPGFANPSNDRIAIAKGAFERYNSWPSYWPDKFDDPIDPGWRNDAVDGNFSKAAWNGYFGKNVFNADAECYWVDDDWANKTKLFYPDSNDHDRRGLGLRMYVRGFQWNKTAVQNGVFALYDLENIGTGVLNKMSFGFKIGNNMGESDAGADAGDDNAAYDRDLDLAYMWDSDDLGAGNFSPVGYMGGSFLESPGNAFDGIDNDGDAQAGIGSEVSIALWATKTISLSENIVLIDYSNFTRRISTLHNELAAQGKSDNDTLIINFGSEVFKYWNGREINYNGQSEIGDNLFDDNLNGLIDESRGLADQAGTFHYLYITDAGVGYKYINYLNPDPNSNGSTNILIDEKRDDGIDNDGDWSVLNDDVGLDGLANTGDEGEGDGLPSSGRGTDRPGEPHIDKTDIDESDMLGLTSFYLYDWGTVFQYNEEHMWTGLFPGTFTYTFATANIELLYGSGFFPISPDQIERFSMALIAGVDLADLVRTKNYFAEAYNQNYNFAKAPYIPNVTAYAGDNRVTLFWDEFAEGSIDPIGGMDFEGYKIYRSTDPGWNDCTPITDGFGTVIFRQPLAQFDLENEYEGFANVATQGVHFWLGTNTGIRHFWVDTTAVNGFQYYYAVTSYDHGDNTRGIDPAECSKYVAIQSSGEIEKDPNVVVIKPEAPAAGFVPANILNSEITPSPANTASGTFTYTVRNPAEVKDNHSYMITFKDTISGTGQNLAYSTRSFTLTDLTANTQVLTDNALTGDIGGLPIVDGIQLAVRNNPARLEIDTVNSAWSRDFINDFNMRPYSFQNTPVRLEAGDYEIRFSDVGVAQSVKFMRGTDSLPAIPVNFTIRNLTNNTDIPFAFRERNGNDGRFTFGISNRRSDEIILLNQDRKTPSWQVMFVASSDAADTSMPRAGDILNLKTTKPFLATDTLWFTTVASKIDNSLAAADLERVKVVPNPYIVTNAWEPENVYSTGRGERQLHFIHLPSRCTIRIFNTRGQLVNTIEHDVADGLNDGTEVWNMLSKDNLDISYGIYIYHITAEGIGEKTGKFVVIK